MSFSDQFDQLAEQIGGRAGRAVRELRDEVRRRIEAGQQELLHQVEEATSGLPESLISRDDLAPLVERAGEEARSAAFGDLAASLAVLDRCRSQAELLNALLAEGGRYASRTAIFLTLDAGAEAWGAHGWDDGAGALVGLTVEYETEAWRRFASGTGAVALRSSDCAALCSRIESPLPVDGVLVPLVLRDRVAAALYADRLEEGTPLPVAALQVLTLAAALMIEGLPFRERPSTPTLRSVVEGGESAEEAVGLPLWGGAAAATVAEEEVEVAPEAEAAPGFEVEVEERPEPEEIVAPESLETVSPTIAQATEAVEISEPADVESAVEAVEEFVEPAPEEIQQAAPAPWSFESLPAESEIAEETAPLGPAGEAAAPEVEPPAPVDEVTAPEPELLAPETEEAAPEIELLAPEAEEAAPEIEPIPPTEERALDAESLHETAMLDASTFAPGPAVAPPPPEPAPAPPPTAPEDESEPAAPRRAPTTERAGGTEVSPPSDFEGPGWAFAPTHVPAAEADDAARHEEARRLARLLVSEIRLYNEDQVEEGRRNRDLYARLREDIERSRQMYEERVDSGILDSTEYFDQELVRILGAGDSAALGLG